MLMEPATVIPAQPLLTLCEQHDEPDVATVFVMQLGQDPKRCIELVDGLDSPMPRSQKWIINLSTQVGCPVACPYCDAGDDYRGNLDVNELLAQVHFVLQRHPKEVERCAKLKVHFSRMGEPALNNAVLDALAALPALVKNPNLWACVASIAPQKRRVWFERLRELRDVHFRGRFQLQISRNSTDALTRRQLVPFPHLDDDEVARLGTWFHQPGERKPVLNYALADGIPFAAQSIADHYDPNVFAIKLTPLNPTVRGAAKGMQTLLRSQREHVLKQAIDELRARRYDVVVSVGDEREDQVGSNCGQAVRRIEKVGWGEA